MCFGFKKAPATFLQTIDVILKTAKGQYSIVYIGDITLFFETPENRLSHIQEVLPLLTNARMTFRMKPWSLFSETVDYVGHVAVSGKLKVASKTTEAIKDS